MSENKAVAKNVKFSQNAKPFRNAKMPANDQPLKNAKHTKYANSNKPFLTEVYTTSQLAEATELVIHSAWRQAGTS